MSLNQLNKMMLLTKLTHWWWRFHRWGPVRAGRRCSVVHCSRMGSLPTVSSWVWPSWRWSTCPPARIGLLCRSYTPVPPVNTPSYRSRAPLRFPSRRRRWKDPRRKLRWSEALRENENKVLLKTLWVKQAFQTAGLSATQHKVA